MPKITNEKHETFCHEYLKDLNATQAYMRVYPDASADSARSSSTNLIANHSIAQRVKELTLERNGRTDNEADRIVKELQSVAYVKISDVFRFDGDFLYARSFDNIPEEAQAAIESVEVVREKGEEAGTILKIKFHSKLKALELLGKHQGMFNSKLQINNGSEEDEGPRLTVVLT